MQPKLKTAPKSAPNVALARAAFQKAIAFHENGQLDQAQLIYEQILAASPRHFDALHLLGMIALQKKQYQRAVDLIGKAIAIHADEPFAFCNHGNALYALGQLDAAVLSYDRAIALKPDYVEAYSNRGDALQGLKRLQEAVASYDRAIALNANAADAYSKRGRALKELKQFEVAVASYDKAIALKPDYVEACYNRSKILHGLKQLTMALAGFDRTIAIQAEHFEAHFYRGNVLSELNQLSEAIVSYDRAIAVKPDYFEAYTNRGNACQGLKQAEAALACYDKAIAIKPDYFEAHSNRGNILTELKQFEAAIASHDRAIAIKPDFAYAYSNRGNAFWKLYQLDEAIASYDQAIAINADYFEAHSNRGNVLADQLQLDAAIASYDRALEINPVFADANWNKSLSLLLLGNFSEGWQLYERRWERPGAPPKRVFAQPMWQGRQALAGKTILLHTEQGFGDTLQFCRYAPLLAAQGAKVILEVEQGLLEVLKTLAGVDQLIVKGGGVPAFDFHCPLMSLPLAFGTNLSSIPSPASYLHSDPATLALFSQQLPPRTKPRVGIVWSGGPTATNDHVRTIQLAQFIAQLPPHCQYVSLQKEVREVDRPTLAAHPEILHFGEQLRDFGDTAALCALMDVVISVDTSVAHLSAALGKPTWILLSYGPDWRWLLEREDSPWYPSARLFRQSSARSWPEVFAKIRIELEKFSANVHADGDGKPSKKWRH